MCFAIFDPEMIFGKCYMVHVETVWDPVIKSSRRIVRDRFYGKFCPMKLRCFTDMFLQMIDFIIVLFEIKSEIPDHWTIFHFPAGSDCCTAEKDLRISND